MDTSFLSDKGLPASGEVAVIGGGPAGLRAAEVLAQASCRVVLYDGKPSVGRKFLVAGRGGLNLTHSEELERFTGRYRDEPGRWQGLLAEFGPAELRAWAAGLGVETYVGTSGRVFPRGQHAAVLLRRWVARLRTLGVDFRVNRRLAGLTREDGGGWRMHLQDPRDGLSETPVFRTVALALGGASWPKTGSDGKWTDFLRPLGVPVAAWHAANCGFEVAWDPGFLQAAEGLPIKNVTVAAGGKTVAGELLVTQYGLEGGALYQLGRELREMDPPQLFIDLKPTFTEDQLRARLWMDLKPRITLAELIAKASRAWKLSPVAEALLRFQARDEQRPLNELAGWVKRFPVTMRRARPVEEAISSAGGVRWEALDEGLGIKGCPGLFVAGEMVDWEAPTGGYLLQGCFATGTRAGRSAAEFNAKTWRPAEGINPDSRTSV